MGREQLVKKPPDEEGERVETVHDSESVLVEDRMVRESMW